MYQSKISGVNDVSTKRMGVVPRAAKSYSGSLVGSGMKFGVVVGRFNDLVTKLLLEGALEHFERHGVPETDVDVRSLVFMDCCMCF